MIYHNFERTQNEFYLMDVHKRHFSKQSLIALSSFVGSTSISTIPFKPFFKENTLSLVMAFFLYESQVLSSFSFVPSRRTICKSSSEKTTTKTLSSILYHRLAEIEYFFTLIPYHHWAETKLTYGNLNKL